jgi:hypothetical protein
MIPPKYHSYRDDGKTIVLYQSTFVTIRAIEVWSSDNCQPDSLRVKLSSTMTLSLKHLDEDIPIENGQCLPENLPRLLNSPYFFGLVTPLFMLRCGNKLPKNHASDPN